MVVMTGAEGPVGWVWWVTAASCGLLFCGSLSLMGAEGMEGKRPLSTPVAMRPRRRRAKKTPESVSLTAPRAGRVT